MEVQQEMPMGTGPNPVIPVECFLEVKTAHILVTFIQSYKRFTPRSGLPEKIISDNSKTFKFAVNIIRRVLSDSEVKTCFTHASTG